MIDFIIFSLFRVVLAVVLLLYALGALEALGVFAWWQRKREEQRKRNISNLR